jgi:hypothetical protein
MDRVTLKHYEERAAKGRELLDKIEELTKAAVHITRIPPSKILMYDDHGNDIAILRGTNERITIIETKLGNNRLVKAINSAVLKIIADEIAQLEAELSAL